MPKQPDDRVGRVVDERYEILEAMASGSMGAVYRAERVPVGKVVAIKFLHASFANDSEFLIRFERETQVMSKLAHPNCVSVVDFGVWEGSPYLVMDFVAGRTLRSLIDAGPIPAPRALALARQIAAGLAHAHAHEIVHRDIKPANIMISDEIGAGERVRILDFGLARLRTGGGRDATQTNVVVGTPNYMAPEQTVGGGIVDARTDIYATGVVLFEMLVGEKPFAAEETMQLLGMHRAAPIPRLVDRLPEAAAAELPDGIQEIIDKAMAKRPDDRFQSGVELADAIAAVLDTIARPTGELRVPASAAVRAAAVVQKAGVAPTMLAIETQQISRPGTRPWKKPVLGAAILIGGIAAGAGYLIYRHGEETAAIVAADAGVVAVIHPDSTPTPTPTPAPTPDAGSGSEIEIDPAAADDPNPNPETTTATDEAADAPKSQAELDKTPVTVQPVLAKTVADAVQMIKDGQKELALNSLRVLWKDAPKSAYIPFLLGNLYFDKMWWGVAMDHYQAAIRINGGYKGNQILNQNVIRTLASPKTQRRAQVFLRSTIGRDAIPFLRYAAAHEPNPTVKKQAAMLAKSLR